MEPKFYLKQNILENGDASWWYHTICCQFVHSGHLLVNVSLFASLNSFVVGYGFSFLIKVKTVLLIYSFFELMNNEK